MTQPEYDQQKRECWEEYLSEHKTTYTRTAFDYAFDRAYSLGKQENDMEDTVIQGWVCRDKKDNVLYLHTEEPYLLLDKSLFPNLTWESDPIEVEIIIKRKKKNL